MASLIINPLNTLSTSSYSLDLVTIMTRNAPYILLKKRCARNTKNGWLNKQEESPNPKQVRKQGTKQVNLTAIML